MKKDLENLLNEWIKERDLLIDSAKKDKVNENRLYERANTIDKCRQEVTALIIRNN